MFALLLNGQIQVFATLLVAIVFSLTLHEYGHAKAAMLLGDNTAARMGRLTLNPMAHIDPLGLLMVIFLGFGYAKSVPINPRNMQKPWAGAAVAAAGPFMNLLLAIVAVNTLAWVAKTGAFELTEARVMALTILAKINLLLMLFNLIPLGPLDGHYILSWWLPPSLGARYDRFNVSYGARIFLGLVILSVIGVPVFRFLMAISAALIPYITFI